MFQLYICVSPLSAASAGLRLGPQSTDFLLMSRIRCSVVNFKHFQKTALIFETKKKKKKDVPSLCLDFRISTVLIYTCFYEKPQGAIPASASHGVIGVLGYEAPQEEEH